jgi:hypothetical protein
MVIDELYKALNLVGLQMGVRRVSELAKTL